VRLLHDYPMLDLVKDRTRVSTRERAMLRALTPQTVLSSQL
jgi:hypothetical protein